MPVGYYGGENSPHVNYDLVQDRTGMQIPDVELATTARDLLNPSGDTTYLRKGLVLCKITGTDTYAHYDEGAADGTQLLHTAVVLLNDVQLDTTNGSHVKVCFAGGTLKRDRLVFATAGGGAAFDADATHQHLPTI